jgi:UDP-N-acetyl-D-glucosamine dehydrogenase
MKREYPNNKILKKIKSKDVIIGIMGLGYVGLPLALNFAKNKFSVYGIDPDTKKLSSLLNKKSYLSNLSNKKLKSIVETQPKKGQICVTDKFQLLNKCDIILICVPTPLTEHLTPDMQYIDSAIDQTIKYSKPRQLIILESTTYPGTTKEIVSKISEKTCLVVGKDFFVCYSPEREDPGNKKFGVSNTPKIVGGYTQDCLDCGIALYKTITKRVISVSSTQVAEMTKLLENIYRNVNIGLINEMKVLCDGLNINIWDVINAAKTKPFGFHAFYPGAGVGGHCINPDPFYLTWKSHEADMPTRFIQLSREINDSMPYYVVGKTQDALNSKGKCIKNSKILIVGLAYKKNINDIRESPALKIIDILKKKEANITYYDPYITIRSLKKLTKPPSSIIEQFDCIIVVTAHDEVDYATIEKYGKLIIDTCNIIQSDNVVKA